MQISELRISGVRNLRTTTLNLEQVNIIYGANGSGKTSLLEAVSILGQARSFRNVRIQAVIHHDESSCTVFGRLRAESRSDQAVPIGVTRERSGAMEAKLRGQKITSSAILAQALPLLIIDSSSFDLLTGGPGTRRKFLDWGVFHVEQGFHTAWLQVRKALKQRNLLLRRGKILPEELAPWSRLFSTAASELDRCRRDYIDKLRPCVQMVLDELGSRIALDIGYSRGWDIDQDLYELLEKGLDRDRARGFTQLGPQRADVRWKSNGHNAIDVFSRGQQKLAVIALKIAQGRLLNENIGKSSIYLVDDLPAELDGAFLQVLFDALLRMGAQLLITCVDPKELNHCWREPYGVTPTMFHVEHGQITQQ